MDNKEPLYNVVIVGDYIDDVYHYGEAASLANEDPVIKFLPHRTEVKPGGVGFCADLFRSIGKGVCTVSAVIKTSESTVVRHVDTRYNRNLFTLDQLDETRTPQPEDLKVIVGYVPDLVLFWDDGRSLPYMIEEVTKVMQELSDACVWLAVDNDSLDKYIVKKADFIKTYSVKALSSPFTACTLGTGPRSVILSDKNRISVLPVPKQNYLIDTCGAGDTLFVTFLVYLLKHHGSIRADAVPIASIEEAVEYGMAAAHIQCEHLGTYIPTWEEIEARKQELFNE